MSKQIVTSDNLKVIARETIVELAAIVKKTLGPGGNPIIIKRDGGACVNNGFIRICRI